MSKLKLSELGFAILLITLGLRNVIDDQATQSHNCGYASTNDDS
ncbi:hypothetical protein DFO58_1311 [Arthrobacter sp. AG1021]|nr:hypothetical protein DFO58_1311 [Arthrobacter sp. AG1021]